MKEKIESDTNVKVIALGEVYEASVIQLETYIDGPIDPVAHEKNRVSGYVIVEEDMGRHVPVSASFNAGNRQLCAEPITVTGMAEVPNGYSYEIRAQGIVPYSKSRYFEEKCETHGIKLLPGFGCPVCSSEVHP